MLFAGGMAIPPGTRNLSDYIDANDPCTLNPSDPICQLTAGDVAKDPCKINPLGPGCQAAVVGATANTPNPGASDSQWNSFIEDPAVTPTWITNLLDKISGSVGLNPAQATGSSAAAGSLANVRIATAAIVVLSLAGVGFFGYTIYKKRRTASRPAV